MQRIYLTKDNFTIDKAREKTGMQEGFWGTLVMPDKRRLYGLLKLDFKSEKYKGILFSTLEIFFSRLARALELQTAVYIPVAAVLRGEFRTDVFSKIFYEIGETPTDIYSLTNEKLSDSKPVGIVDYIKIFTSLPNGKELIYQFTEYALFNFTIMSIDYSNYNIVLLKDANDTLRLAPMHDFSLTELTNLLRRNLSVREFSKKTVRCKNRKAFFKMSVDENGEKSYNDGILKLAEIYPSAAREFAMRLLDFKNAEKAHAILYAMLSDNLTDAKTAKKIEIYCNAVVSETIRLLDFL